MENDCFHHIGVNVHVKQEMINLQHLVYKAYILLETIIYPDRGCQRAEKYGKKHFS